MGVLRLCTYTHIAIESVVNGILLIICIIRRNTLDGCQFRRNILSYCRCSTYLSGDIITAKYLIDKDIASGVLAINIDE